MLRHLISMTYFYIYFNQFSNILEYILLLQTACYDPFVLVSLTDPLFLECDSFLFISDPLFYRIVCIGTLPYSCHFIFENGPSCTVRKLDNKEIYY